MRYLIDWSRVSGLGSRVSGLGSRVSGLVLVQQNGSLPVHANDDNL